MLKRGHGYLAPNVEDFLSLIKYANLLITDSFHGTAFAVNYGKPVFTVVKDKEASDSRQVSLMHNVGLDAQVLSVKEAMPDVSRFSYDISEEQDRLESLRRASMDYLRNAITNE